MPDNHKGIGLPTVSEGTVRRLLRQLARYTDPSRRVPRIDLRQHRHPPVQLLIIPDANRQENAPIQQSDQRLFCAH